MKTLSPIALFCYNRPEHTAQTLKALRDNLLAKDSELFIFCDGPRSERELEKIKEIHKIIDNTSGFKKVVTRKLSLNRGLANSVISGINEIFEKYESVIVLEDDIVTSPNFLSFMNNALEFYRNNKNIFSITGFNYPNTIFRTPSSCPEKIFFVKGRGCSWGWATWKDRWQKVDFSVNGYKDFLGSKKIQKQFNKSGKNLSEMLLLQISEKIDSWAIRVAYHQFKNQLCTVFPLETLVKNIGFDGDGSHGDLNKKIADFSFKETVKLPIFKHPNDLNNNHPLEKEYVRCASGKKEFFFKKRIIKIKYITIGFLIAEILNFIF